jgi:hypothetical protein
MHAAEIVVKEIERNLMRVILEFLAESVCQPRESAHPHSHAEVLALHVAGRDVFRIRIPSKHSGAASDAGCF